MKVRDFWNSLPNKEEMIKKIRSLKEAKRREAFLSQFQTCAACGSQIRFAHASNYLTNTLIETCTCSQCGQTPQERLYTLN